MTRLITSVSKLDTIALVPLRAGSKGFPGKNVSLLGKRPLYQHAVDQALRVCKTCIVSTDIDEILKGEKLDRVAYFERSLDSSADNAPMIDVLIETLLSLKIHQKIIVLLQATSPLRRDADIRNAIDLYHSGAYDLVMSVTQGDSSVLKYGTVRGNTFEPVTNAAYCFQNRQNLPPVFRPNGAVYVFSSDWLLANKNLGSGTIGVTVMTADHSIDIDTAQDFERVSEIMKMS
jgi:CMP-N,N'-diacetyllegionaminic acid synthase